MGYYYFYCTLHTEYLCLRCSSLLGSVPILVSASLTLLQYETQTLSGNRPLIAKFLSEVARNPTMKTWSVEDVYKWLKLTCRMNEEIAEKFKTKDIDGTKLHALTADEVEKIMEENGFDSLFGDIILKGRDTLKEEELKIAQLNNEDPEDQDGSFSEKFRNFDTAVTLTDKYRENALFPEYESRPGNLLEPVRRYVHFPSLDPNGKYMAQLARETILFANACITGRTNGCIHFGVEDRKILGIPLSCEQSVIEKELSKYLREAFSDYQIHTVLQCARPIKFVKVVPSTKQLKYVLEVEIRPESTLCNNEVFFCKPPQAVKVNKAEVKIVNGKPAVYELTENGPTEIEDQALVDYIGNFKDKLCKKRERCEQMARNRTRKYIPEKEKKKLIHALCHGEDSLKGGERHPFLILSPPDEHMDEDFLAENMSFLSCIEWNAVLDTGSDGKIYKYMQNKGHLFRDRECEEMDPTTDKNMQSPDKIVELKEDISLSPQASWIFTNGSEEIKSKNMELKEWKQLRRRGCREFVDFYSKELQTSRCIFVFVLLSRNYDVMLEIANEVCSTFQNEILCIAENTQTAEPWMEKLIDKYDVGKDTLETRTVSGLDWQHISAIVEEISEKDLTSEIKLTTKGGAEITLPDLKKNELADLDILSAKQCEGVLQNAEEKERVRSEKEKHFYRGGCPDWWNYWFKTQVCTRSKHERLKQMVKDNLEGRAFHTEDGTGQVTLYHEPGAGGTTSAKHVLWDLRTEYRCAEIKNITPATYDQIETFYSFKESTQPGDVPRPVLLLLDNPDEDKAMDLMAKIKEKARQVAADGEHMFCVFLLVLRKRSAILSEDDDMNTLALRHHLDDTELAWFETTYNKMLATFQKTNEKMEKREENHPKTLVAFNIMKENFDRAYIERTVRGIVNRIEDDKELKLLKMLSVLNMYDIHQRPILTSAFDHFMNQTDLPRGLKFSWGIIGSHRRPDALILWENHLSRDIRILLNVNSGHIQAMKLKTICIFHPLMSEAILKVLRERNFLRQEEQSIPSQDPEQIPLSDIVLEVLYLPFLKFKAIYAIRTLLRTNIAGILKNRERRSTGKVDKFSPLIQEILQKEGTVAASEVLKMGYECTEDVYVCQQVARILIEGRKWDEAHLYAKMATEAVKENSWLWHTRGQVFHCQLLEKLQQIKDYASATNDCTADVLQAVLLAKAGVDIYKKVQEYANTKDTRRNLAGHLGEMYISRMVLECLSYLPCFSSRRSRSQGPQKLVNLQRFLEEPDYIPYQIANWSKVDGVNYLEFLKNIRTNVLRRFESVGDELTQLKGTYLDRYQKREHERNNKSLEELEEPLHRYIGSDVDTIPPDHHLASSQREKIFHLKGMNLGKIFHYGRGEDGQQRLLQLLQKANVLAGRNEMGYLRCLIGINLVNQCLYPWIPPNVTLRELQEWSHKLYRGQSVHEHLEPYLFFVTLNWNTGETNPINIQEAISKWEEAYYRKYPHHRGENHLNRERPREVFYLGKKDGLSSIISSSSLRYQVNRQGRRIPFFKDLFTMQCLRRFSGVLVDDGTKVKIDVKYKGHSSNLEIKLDRPITYRLHWKKPVHFFLGFTWIGPKALNVIPNMSTSLHDYNANIERLSRQQVPQPYQQKFYHGGVTH